MVKILEAIKYPFKKFPRMLNFFWSIIPVIGTFAVLGYILKIINAVRKNLKELPPFGSFTENLKDGFKAFIWEIGIGIPLIVLLAVAGYIPVLSDLLVPILLILAGMTVPIMFIQFAEKRDFKDGFDVKRAFQFVRNNFISELILIIKLIIFAIILLIASLPIVTMIITLPVATYGSYYMWASFYREVGKPTKKRKPAKKKRKK